MRRILNDKRKLCYVKSAGTIVELGCLTGPIKEARIGIETLLLMIRNGKEVYEINPSNPEEMVRLTVSNVSKDNFSSVTETREMASKREVESPVNQPDVINTPMTPDTIVSDSTAEMNLSPVEKTDEPEIETTPYKTQEQSSMYQQNHQKNGKKQQNDFKKR